MPFSGDVLSIFRRFTCEVVPVESILAESGEQKLLTSVLHKKKEQNKLVFFRNTWHRHFFFFFQIKHLTRCVNNEK